jgi:hypothetical protein
MLDPLLPATVSPEQQCEWDEWKTILQPFLDNNDMWLTAPWVVTEFYVYRRLVEEAIGHWDETSPGYRSDPFEKQNAVLESSVGSVEPMLSKIPTLPKSSSEDIEIAAFIALWGNKMDLSYRCAFENNLHSSNICFLCPIL